jgi:hypothetical protein
VKRIPSLDGLRAISITFLVLSHMSKSGHAPRIFYQFAASGVSIFFVISAYLITSILLREREQTETINLREFYVRRAYRIFPRGAGIHGRSHRSILAANSLVSHRCRPVVRCQLRPHSPVGFRTLVVAEHRGAVLFPLAGSLETLVPAPRCHRGRSATAGPPVWKAVMIYFKVSWGAWAFPALADNLAIGCLLAIFAPRLSRVNPCLASAMAGAAMSVQFFMADTAARTLLVLIVLKPVFYVSLAGVLLHVVQRPYRVLNWSPVVWLGQISYSLYLWRRSPHALRLFGPCDRCLRLSFLLLS